MVKFRETNNRMVLPEAGKMGKGELLFNWYRVSALQEEKSSGDLREQQCDCI